MKLLYGTTNRAKLDAMKKALAGLSIELIGLGELSGKPFTRLWCGLETIRNGSVQSEGSILEKQLSASKIRQMAFL